MSQEGGAEAEDRPARGRDSSRLGHRGVAGLRLRKEPGGGRGGLGLRVCEGGEGGKLGSLSGPWGGATAPGVCLG